MPKDQTPGELKMSKDQPAAKQGQKPDIYTFTRLAFQPADSTHGRACFKNGDGTVERVYSPKQMHLIHQCLGLEPKAHYWDAPLRGTWERVAHAPTPESHEDALRGTVDFILIHHDEVHKALAFTQTAIPPVPPREPGL